MLEPSVGPNSPVSILIVVVCNTVHRRDARMQTTIAKEPTLPAPLWPSRQNNLLRSNSSEMPRTAWKSLLCQRKYKIWVATQANWDLVAHAERAAKEIFRYKPEQRICEIRRFTTGNS